jgi:hypothetical protein
VIPIISYPDFYQNGLLLSPSRYQKDQPAYQGAVLQTLSPSYDSTFLFGVGSLLPYSMVGVRCDKGLLASIKHASKIGTGRRLARCLVRCLVTCLERCRVRCLDGCLVKCLVRCLDFTIEMPCARTKDACI